MSEASSRPVRRSPVGAGISAMWVASSGTDVQLPVVISTFCRRVSCGLVSEPRLVVFSVEEERQRLLQPQQIHNLPVQSLVAVGPYIPAGNFVAEPHLRIDEEGRGQPGHPIRIEAWLSGVGETWVGGGQRFSRT